MILLIQKGPLKNWNEVSTRTCDITEECIKINYEGARRMVEEFLYLLQLSDWPRIVNVSSTSGMLKVELKESRTYYVTVPHIYFHEMPRRRNHLFLQIN